MSARAEHYIANQIGQTHLEVARLLEIIEAKDAGITEMRNLNASMIEVLTDAQKRKLGLEGEIIEEPA